MGLVEDLGKNMENMPKNCEFGKFSVPYSD